MSRPVFAYIDTVALQHNLSVIRRHVGTSRIIAVVKADGYGHGLARIAQALLGADSCAVASIDEAIQLRELGWTKPILLLEGVFEIEEIRYCIQYDLSIVIHHYEQINMLRAAKLTQTIPVFIKFNSGMNRLGFKQDAFRTALAQIQSIAMLSPITLMSHFATADDDNGISTQMNIIQQQFARLPYPTSLANSAAALRYPASHGEWIRAGIALYGASPFADTRADTLDLRPVMTLHSRIIAVQTLMTGEALGYGLIWVAERNSRIGIVACGYADGYPRHASTGTPILVNGQRTQVLGRVSMDMLFVDLTQLPDAGVGSQVILWGQGLPVEEVAQAAGTISYELLCARAKRVTEREL
ncbi:MAG: alanine racemase [Sulfuriferula sp.]|nr:alanine racemase [Sulfuriferula sp.]